MTAAVEHLEPVSGLEWTRLSGTREDVMRALGALHAAPIRAWRERETGAWQRLLERTAGAAKERFEAIVEATTARLPLEAQELTWIAEGAGVPVRELWALNLRGDLGRDGTGCSDVCAVTETGVVMGHNEDGDGDLEGAIRLITLVIDGDPSMTVVWYPGMLPANSFVTTSAGLSFGMDHVPVSVPNTEGCGRHFVARRAQRQEEGVVARAVLSAVPCAGGFAFDVADALGRGDLIENVAGRYSVASAVAAASDAPAEGGALLHTNHLRLVDGTEDGLAVAADDEWLGESQGRLRALVSAAPSVRSAADVLTALRAPGVLNRSEDIYTFATCVVDTAADTIWVQGSGEVWAGWLSAFARGERVAA
ncbi:cysteine protease [Galactobacter valiniphilus]|uniref:Cysteine protease n=1 Tax=Galactobacter valiniphilus TaxID=2676122 RepID=A0A399JC53_9MICC|nr:C45 family peptidase [Galactobacter valiniphilus]RII41809.1 cysteine protease [Galactobacter valiniphilus]